jgi:hypothetical protein
MVDPLCQFRHEVSQVHGPKGIAVCDEKPAHLEQWKNQQVLQRWTCMNIRFLSISLFFAYPLFTKTSH